MTISPAQHGARLAINVAGTPVPQGSKTAHVLKGRAILRDANSKALKPWRKTVHDTATDACRYVPTIDGPVRVWLRFAFARPASHFRTGRNAHLLKDTAPVFPQSKNDLDKLTRAVLDSLTTAGVWTDDGLVVDVRARKFYAGEHELAPTRPGVDILIEAVTR